MNEKADEAQANKNVENGAVKISPNQFPNIKKTKHFK